MDTKNLFLTILFTVIGWEFGKMIGKLGGKYIISKFKD
jgi:hypothetical protein